ncbi:heat shock protein 68-like [Aphidius gifuensis]|uniref:heat shock protein 68-like n=1 Tax=Aphidius gifuensis TaxID=684658 RepID=UPI001CDCCA92|nr:heat shock protein 68-like [Aphidius gifuensis]
MPAIGIDLGTTYSCVAVWKGGQVEVIANSQGHRITPSYVAFTKTERLIGDGAKNQIAMNPTNTVFDVKRLIGRQFDDVQIQSDIKHWPFAVVSDNNNPKIQVEFLGEVKKFSPEEISSMVLEKMKETAEAFLGEQVKDAVITVPAYFNNSQRQATIDAGKIAGLNVLRIINEPTAAALAYGLDNNLNSEKNILVFDLGGGTADVSILSIEEGSTFEVKSTAGDNHLGGEDFDTRLVDYLCAEFNKKFKKDIKDNQKALRRLRTAAVHAKQQLSSSTVANVVVDALFDGIDFSLEISRAKFESLCADLFSKAIELVEQALEDADIDKLTIDDVVLVGGSTRIPKIQAMLQNYFCGKQLNLTINPDEAVANGAAVQAALLTGERMKSSILQKVVLRDVTSLSLGIGTKIDTMTKIIMKNTKIPCKNSKTVVTLSDNQTVVSFPVYEGEHERTSLNNYLGKFVLSGVTPAPAGEEEMDVTFDLNADGILHVTSRDRKTGRSNDIILKNVGRLSQNEIDNLISEAEAYKNYDKQQKETFLAKNQLEAYVLSVKQAIEDTSFKLCDDDKKQLAKICDENITWLEANHNVKTKEYNEKLQQVESICMSIMAKKDKEAIAAKNQLYKYVTIIKKAVSNDSTKLTKEKQSQIVEICEDTEKWLEKKKHAEKEESNTMFEAIQKMCTLIMSKKEEERILSRHELESYVSSIKLATENGSFDISANKIQHVIKVCSDTMHWLHANQLSDKEVFLEKLKLVQTELDSFPLDK